MKEDQERTPLRTILQNFLNHIESLEIQRVEDSYEKEFQELKFFSEILKTSKQYSCSEGEKEVNKKKNRYKDILPFDNSRVILSEYAGIPGSDYINANYIKGASGSPAYIACQGPLPHTVNDFWRMVVECEVQVIVMACNEEEAGKHKCENYWVEREGEEKQFGMVSIRLVKASTVCPDFLVRTMRLKYTTSQNPHTTEERTVCQFHYSAWPDHGVPPLVRPLLDMVRLVRDTQASETLPVLVHCSAGCGRTGTICAIDYVWGLLRAGKLSKDFSLYKLVQDMRKQRIAMVQTKEQYVLVHQAVRELFREQLRMIDSHPYENIDANGMPLVKEDQEPLYASPIITPTEISNEEKQDGKEKEIEVTVPPLPQKKRGCIASSKQEKEVENLTEKQRSIVEQASSVSSSSLSSASSISHTFHKPRIAKLKALFERSPGTRESRSSQSKQRSQSVSRSHSLGAMRIKTESQEETQQAAKEVNANRLIPSHGILKIPQLPGVTSMRPSLPVKRSKSLKVLGSSQHCKLSLASIAPSSTSDDNVDTGAISRIQSSIISSGREESISRSKPFVPPKKFLTKSRESNVAGDDGVNRKGEMPLDWVAYRSSHNVPRRRRSLESVNFENIDNPDESSVTVQTQFRKSQILDDNALKLLQDCKQYLVSNGNHKNPQVSAPGSSLTVEAQKKVTAIIAGLGVRERRNSFRQAVSTGREGDAKPGKKIKAYETIWPNAGAVAMPLKQGQEAGCEAKTNVVYAQIHQVKGKSSNWFNRRSPQSSRQESLSVEEKRNSPTITGGGKHPASQSPALQHNHIISTSGNIDNPNIRLGKLGVQPSQLSKNKVTPDKRLPVSAEPQPPPPKVASVWSRKPKVSPSPSTVDFRSRQHYNPAEQDSMNCWTGKTAVASKVTRKEVPYKPISYAGHCQYKSPPPHPVVEANCQFLGTEAGCRFADTSGHNRMAAPPSTIPMNRPSEKQEVSYGLVAGVQMRPGSRDDLALCPSPAAANATGPHAPARVRRHASVVLLRRSLAETGGVGQSSSSLSQPTLTIWNSPTQGNGEKSAVPNPHHIQGLDTSSNGSWLQAPGVDVDSVAASIAPFHGDQQASNVAKALENLHVHKMTHHHVSSSPSLSSSLSNGFSSPQLSQPSTMIGKKQHYF